MKLLVLGVVFMGEAVAVFLELYLANRFRGQGTFPEISRAILLLVPLFIISFVLLLYGYTYGFRAFQKIWAISIISWGSILLVEPFLAYYFFQEFPSGNTLVAGILALAAIIISVFG